MRPTPKVLLVLALAALFQGCGGTAEPQTRRPTATATLTETGGVRPSDGGQAPVSECFEGQTTGCYTTCGSIGTAWCGNSSWSTDCQVPAERCANGIDDDCDGLRDGHDPDCQACTPGQTRPCTASCGSGGTIKCLANGQWATHCWAPSESCSNGADDDCDGLKDGVDLDCQVCAPGQTKACTTSCGSGGTKDCESSGQWATSCWAPSENCVNGADDDCDGLADANDPECQVCTPGASRGCSTACGSTGLEECGGAGTWNTCRPPLETCDNGGDDDCDGKSDGSDPDCQVCTPGQKRTCATSCGSDGEETCEGTGQWGSCRLPLEVCTNGSDDDCDGSTDGNDTDCQVCTPGSTRVCTSSCGGPGTQDCESNGQWKPICRPPLEVCGNGIDDDCDGKVDGRDFDCPSTIYKCEDFEGGSCNGDMGYGDKCGAADNTGGCSPQRFWAWCNRRNPAYPNIWDGWIQNWVDSRCDGALAETGTQYSTWYCTSSTNDRYECTTPLVLSFDGAPVQLAEPAAASFAFTPGAPVLSSWPKAVNPWLVRDLDGNGRIDDGRELFGSDTRLASGANAPHGFAALTELDDNQDGKVDAKDASFASLRLWADVDGDRATGPGELKTLEAAGVRSLSVRFTLAPRCDRAGNCERERASFEWVDRAGWVHEGAVVDIYLRTRPARLSPKALACVDPVSDPRGGGAGLPRTLR